MLLLFLAEDVQHQPTCFGRSAKKEKKKSKIFVFLL